MTKSDKYAPKHRAPGKHKVVRTASRRAVRQSLVLTGVAAAATGLVVSNGVSATPSASPSASSSSSSSGVITSAAVQTPDAIDSVTGVERRDRRAVVSRSDRRGGADGRETAAREVEKQPAATRVEGPSKADPRDIARALLPEFGFSESEFDCLDSLYVSESDWRVDADNPTSSAYGIPQALTELHDLPPDYMTSAESQIRWGLGYIRDTYGTPCSAWSFKAGNGWY